MRAWLLVLLALVGCAASATRSRVVSAVQSGAYAQAVHAYETEGRDRSVLQALALRLLELDAESPDPPRKHAAFTEFGLLGDRVRSVLARLAERQRPASTRAMALRLLFRLDDCVARAELRSLAQHSDPDVADIAFAALDPELERARVLKALSAPRASRRLAALTLLIATQSPTDLALVAEVSRLDPEPAVRAAALSVLERQPKTALSALERALHDEAESVRTAAVRALARAAPEQAAAYLDQQLGAATTAESLVAATELLRMRPPREPARAWDAVVRALTASDANLRAQAAVLLSTLPSALQDAAVLRGQLRVETHPAAKLALAVALGTTDPSARKALRELAQGPSLPAAQAAYELARLGEQTAADRLTALRTSPAALVRATVARLVGRQLHQPESIAALLADRDPGVRAAAAGAVLAELLTPETR